MYFMERQTFRVVGPFDKPIAFHTYFYELVYLLFYIAIIHNHSYRSRYAIWICKKIRMDRKAHIYDIILKITVIASCHTIESFISRLKAKQTCDTNYIQNKKKCWIVLFSI